MIIDPTAAARRPDEERVREWLTEQRVFISSAMGDTAEERRAVAQAVEEEGARPVWFEEFGARDADPEEAYLGEVDSSTIYLAILNELYGPQHRSGFSATDTEYLRAREGGKRVAVWTAAAPAREVISTASSNACASSTRPRTTRTQPISPGACVGVCASSRPRRSRHG